MKRTTLILTLAALCIGLPAKVFSQEAKPVTLQPRSAVSQASPPPKTGTSLQRADASQRSLMAAGKISPKPLAKAVPSRKALQKAKPASVADLQGNYVMTYETLLTNGYDGGLAVEIAPVAGAADSIEIVNFYDDGVKIRAKVDFTTGTVSIPNQIAFTSENYGAIDLAVVANDNGMPVPDRRSQITGTIADDGTISITSWWGMFVKSGENADKYFGCYANASFEKANATMSQTMLNKKQLTKSSYSVVATQVAPNLIRVKNFANFGHTVDIELNSDKTSTIASQLVWQNSTYGDFYTKAITYDAEKETLTATADNITTAAATDNRGITWKDWSFVGASAFYAILTEGSLQTDFDISYPAAGASDFSGAGTQADPYLIKTVGDLVLLAKKANSIPESEYDGTEGSNKFAKAFLGKYFRLESDIDAQGYRLSPIAGDWAHRFAGTFDGNNHAIKNISIATAATNYTGLFGRITDEGTVRNLTLDKPSVTSRGNAVGAIAGSSTGTIDNCHTVNAYIYTDGQAAGSIAGTASTITNSSATGSKVTVRKGYAGGIAGEIDKLVENCHAESTDVTMYSPNTGYPAGGIVGSLYYATARNCYFSGKVDAYSTVTAGAFLGGIAGTCAAGTIEKSFSVATILGYGTETASGGIVGVLHGNIADCYSIGRVQNPSSRRTGGITGYVGAYTDPEENPLQSSVKNTYTSTAIMAETYRYDPEKEAREILGQIQEQTTPVTENIYFDKKVTNLTTKQYGVETAFLTKAAGVQGFSSDTWTFADGQYPRLKGIDTNEIAYLGASAVITPDGSSLNKLAADAELHPMGKTTYKLLNNEVLGNEGHFSSIADGKLKIKDAFGTDTLFVENGDSRIYYFVKVAPVPFEGEGTEVNPYLIKTKADLVKLSEVTTTDKQQFPDTYFRMTNDIDLENDQAFLGISLSDDVSNEFLGTFDGGGFTIHKLYEERIVWTVLPEDDPQWGGTPANKYDNGYGGFVGILGTTGTVKNLNIAADSKFLTWATTGAIVGQNYGTVENCKNYSEVRCFGSWVGGIVGQNQREGKVLNCYNEGPVFSGFTTAGGIVGANYGLIENSANAGDVQVKRLSSLRKNGKTLRYAGGIAGTNSNAAIRNVVNAGNVYAYTGRAGGIAGSLPQSYDETSPYRNDLSNAINYGTVATTRDKEYGTMIGEGVSGGKIADNYFDAQIFTFKANANEDKEGMTGVETTVLTSGTALKNFDTELWDFTKGQYPALKQFAAEGKMAKARKTIVTMTSGVTAKDVNKNAALSQEEGLAWSLIKGDAFTINGATLNSPATVEDLVVDTLVAKYGDYSKQIELRRLPNLLLQGEGTEESPYLITSGTDWNTLAGYMQKIGETFDGKYLKVANSFDFKEGEFTTLGSTDVPLQGNFNGNGNTIGGINYTSTDSYDGVFRVIGSNALISDLTLKGEVSTSKFYIGGFAGEIYGKLSKCVNEINVSCDDDGASGFGYIHGSATLTDCVNKGTITATGEAIAGFAYMMAQPEGSEPGAQFIRCINEGKIVNNGKDKYTAGLIAKAYPCRLEECVNKGTIEITNQATTQAVAGLIAYAQNANSLGYDIVRSHNEVDITAGALVAGLVGQVQSSSSNRNALRLVESYNTGNISAVSTSTVRNAPTAGLTAFYTPGSTYTDCYNTGSVKSEKNAYTAGIAAYYFDSSNKDNPITFTRTTNSGNIVANGEQGGGITAYARGYLTIDNCSNTGNVNGTYSLGGLVGYIASSDVVISNSFNSGNITNASSKTGGLIGAGTANARVTNSFNTGEVATTGTEGGTSYTNGYAVGGLAGESGAVFTTCYNTGTVTGASQVGGLIGTPAKNYTQVIRCYNAGKIVADADTCGGIIGVNTDNGRLWTEQNKVEGSFFVSDYGQQANNKVGTAATIAELAKADLGEGWMAGDDYTLPMVATLAKIPQALVNAVTLAFAEGDAQDAVTQNFFVGAPEGITWTASVPNITFSGTDAIFSNEVFEGQAILTATAGEYSKQFTIECIKSASGLDGLNAGRTVTSEVFFNAAGVQVPKPANADGAVYIVRRIYSDGTADIVKLFNNK